MANNSMAPEKQAPGRRRFVWAVGLLSALAGVTGAGGLCFNRKKDVLSCGPTGEKKTVKMLTQNGKLVEIDASLLAAGSKKITDAELQHWIKLRTV